MIGIAVDRLLMLLVGVTFLGGGLWIAKSALDSKNLMETSIFGLMVVATGLFLIVAAIAGPPDQ
ncbi:MAG: hypothetical protein U0105_03480 [Candidatus Obscuribacterales bacterium]|jgi:hypothetical protein